MRKLIDLSKLFHKLPVGIIKSDSEGNLSAASSEDIADAIAPGTFAAPEHLHDGTYSPVSHDHDGTYSPVSHDHDSDYAPISHDHSGYGLLKKGSNSFTDNDMSQTFTDAACTADSLVTIIITSTTIPQGVWSVESANGSFTITSTMPETDDITFDYYIQKAVS